MRMIESQMCSAVKNSEDWISANTAVHYDPSSGASSVYLHGNKIAEIGDGYLILSDGGHQSNTTKSRLNAILSEFGYSCGTANERVYARQFEWFVRVINPTDKKAHEIKFRNGMILK